MLSSNLSNLPNQLLKAKCTWQLTTIIFYKHYSLHNCKGKHIIGPMHQGEGRKRPFQCQDFTGKSLWIFKMKPEVQRWGKPNYIREHQHKPLEQCIKWTQTLALQKGSPWCSRARRIIDWSPLFATSSFLDKAKTLHPINWATNGRHCTQNYALTVACGHKSSH